MRRKGTGRLTRRADHTDPPPPPRLLTVRLRLALLLSVHPCHVTTAQDTHRQQQQQQRMTANYSHPTTATCLRTNELRGTCVNVGFSSQGGPTDNNGPALRCASPANTTRLRPPPPDATLSTRRSQGALLQRRLLHPLRRLASRSEEHTSELQSRGHLVCRLLLEKQ